MTADTCRKTREYLHAFLDDELPCELSYSVQEHLNTCEGCRAFSRFEKGFTSAMQKRLGDVEAPAGLFDRVRARTDEPVPDASASVDRHRRRPWGRYGFPAYASAAALLLVALLPALEFVAPGTVSGIADAVAGVRRADGVLVCVECARQGVPVEHHRFCRAPGHQTGVRCSGDDPWRLVASDATLPLMRDPSFRGERVVVEGRFLEDIGYIDARSITLAANR